ncbi:MAG: hypothetical protein ACE5JL_17985, partial [Dehalococcoidia bacterium]
MGNSTDIKRVGDMRTPVNARLRSKPDQRGISHRNISFLEEEREKLEKELSRLERRTRRVQASLAETLDTINKLRWQAEAEDASGET